MAAVAEARGSGGEGGRGSALKSHKVDAVGDQLDAAGEGRFELQQTGRGDDCQVRSGQEIAFLG